MPIQDLAREDVVTASPDTPVADVARMMDEQTIGSVVVTEGDEPIGIVTDRDLAIRVVAESADPSDHSVGDVMSTELFTVTPDMGFYQAAETMRANGVTIGLGTDNSTLSDTVNPLADLRLAALAHKGHHTDPGVVTAGEALDMVTIDAANDHLSLSYPLWGGR